MRLIMHFGYDVTCNMSITKFCHFKKKCGYGAFQHHLDHAFWVPLTVWVHGRVQVWVRLGTTVLN